MRSVFGLLVALAALFIIWLWATGRFDAAYSAIKNGNTNPAPNTTNLPGSGGGSKTPGMGWGSLAAIMNQGSYVQVTPSFVMPKIPNYMATG